MCKIKRINDEIINIQIKKSKESKRKRDIYCFHRQEEKIQRMINAIQPDSYLPPHKHQEKTEVFLALKGRLLVVEYDDEGNISDKAIIGINELSKGAEIAPETWHNIIALEKDSVAYEIIEGPYIAEEHKIFPGWVPKEEEYEKGRKFINKIKKEVLGQKNS